MTVCEKCRKRMKIQTITFNFGQGLEELELEACLKCRILHVANETWTIKV